MSNPLVISSIRFCCGYCCYSDCLGFVLLYIVVLTFGNVSLVEHNIWCAFVCFFLFYSTNTIPKNVHSHALHDYLFQKSKLHCLHKRVFSCFHRHIEKQIHQALFKLVGCSFFVISNALFIIRVAMGSWFLVSISIYTHNNTTYKISNHIHWFMNIFFHRSLCSRILNHK